MLKGFDLVYREYELKFFKGCVYCDLIRKYDMLKTCLPTRLEDIASDIVDCSGRAKKNNEEDFDNGMTYITVKEAMTKLNQGLKEAGENPDKYLPKSWSGTFEEELLTDAFWGLVFMKDKELRKRAEVGYILDTNKISIGYCGYSEKLQRLLPYYLTTFDNWVFLIDAVKGIVYRSKSKQSGTFEKRENKIYYGERLLAEETELGSVDFFFEKEIWMKDLKEAEREAKRAAGHQVKDTKWLSSPLGNLHNRNSYIRCHTFICLMVYGFDWVKYALMDSNSILSIDHTNAIHDDNRIDNLALTSRSANNSKKAKIENIFDYFLYFMGMGQIEVQTEELSEEKEEKIEELKPIEDNPLCKVADSIEDIVAFLSMQGLCPAVYNA